MSARKEIQKNQRPSQWKRLGLIGLAVLIAMALPGAFLWRVRGSVILTPAEDTDAGEPVFYNQTDIRWAEDFLGQSKFTMKQSGCLVTCIAAALEMREDPDGVMTPGELNQYFSDHQVYDAKGNLQWDALRELKGLQVVVSQTIDTREITGYLNRRIYPIVRVRMNGLGNFHYVLIVKAENGMYYCMDPLGERQKLVPLSEFGTRVYAVRYVWGSKGIES